MESSFSYGEWCLIALGVFYIGLVIVSTVNLMCNAAIKIALIIVHKK
jgi:hypothetical protein